MDQSMLYRSVLRVSLVVTACVLVFQSGMISEKTALVFTDATNQLANSVGATATVQTTELNTLTAELTKQQQLLAQREEQIAEREISLGLTTGEESDRNTTTYILAAILFIQLLLIVLNYGLDYLRAKESQTSKPAANL